MTTLYRKYRPQTFKDLVGQEFIVQTIMNEVAMGKIAHAYLFAGPRGVGKTTMARLLAKAVNCEKRQDGTSEPCNECASCQEITIGRHIDVLEIDAASQTGVDNVRENIIENAQFRPTKSHYKVFIIDEVHMLSTSAFNALLKTLEEPPAHVVFILATTDLHKLPATVISRCQRFSFRRIGYDAMLQELQSICKKEAVKVDEEVLTRIIAKSDGGLRDAESLLGQILSLNLKKITTADTELILPSSDVESVLSLLAALHEKKAATALALVDTLVQSGANLDQFMLDCLDTLRAIMLLQVSATDEDSALYSKEQFKKMKKSALDFNAHQVIALIDTLMRRRLEIRLAPIPQLPLELLIVEFCAAHSISTEASQSTEVKNAAPSPAPTPTTAPVAPASEKPASTISSTIKNAINNLAHTTTITTTIEELQQKWDAIIRKIGESNHSLTFVLKMCRLKQVDHGGLLLTVPYSLHKEKIEEVKSRRIIEDAIESICAQRIPVYCTIESQQTANNDLNDVAAAFGGEVVG